jgi:hypothetical protein
MNYWPRKNEVKNLNFWLSYTRDGEYTKMQKKYSNLAYISQLILDQKLDNEIFLYCSTEDNME